MPSIVGLLSKFSDDSTHRYFSHSKRVIEKRNRIKFVTWHRFEPLDCGSGWENSEILILMGMKLYL